MAVNKLGFSVLIKHHIKKQEIIDAEIAALVECFPDLNATKLAREYKRNDSPYNQDFVEVIDFIDYDKMLTSFAKLSFRENLEIRPISKRFYPHNELASHVVGYVGRANLKDVEIDPTAKLTGQMGRSGVERYYHELLQGESGERKTRVTALNQEIEQVSYKKPSSSDIVLTLDMELQEYLAEAYAPDAIGVFFGPVFHGLDVDDFEKVEDNDWGFTVGMKLHFADGVYINGGADLFNDDQNLYFNLGVRF